MRSISLSKFANRRIGCWGNFNHQISPFSFSSCGVTSRACPERAGTGGGGGRILYTKRVPCLRLRHFSLRVPSGRADDKLTPSSHTRSLGRGPKMHAASYKAGSAARPRSLPFLICDITFERPFWGCLFRFPSFCFGMSSDRISDLRSPPFRFDKRFLVLR
jgi:hypothetical protein